MKKTSFKLTILGVILSVLYGCSGLSDVVTYKIRNNTNQELVNVSFYALGTNSKSLLIERGKVKKGEFYEQSVDQTNMFKGDGVVMIELTEVNRPQRKASVGSFSGGVGLNKNVLVEIEQDTILVRYNP